MRLESASRGLILDISALAAITLACKPVGAPISGTTHSERPPVSNASQGDRGDAGPDADVVLEKRSWTPIATAPTPPDDALVATGMAVGRSLFAHHQMTGWAASYDPCRESWLAHERVRNELARADLLAVDETHAAFCCGPPDGSGLMFDVTQAAPQIIPPFPRTPYPGRHKQALRHGFLTPTDKRFDTRSKRWTVVPFGDDIYKAAGLQDSAVRAGNDWVFTWGGRRWDLSAGATAVFDVGALFDGRTNRWQVVSRNDAPSPRHSATSVWTGSEFFVYGGVTSAASTDQEVSTGGGSYDPVTDRWSPVKGGPRLAAPLASTVAGRTVLVWDAQRGAAYDLDQGSWREFGLPYRVPLQSRVYGHGRLALVASTEVFVLDPKTLRWSQIALPQKMAGRNNRVSVMTSSHLAIWGGERIVSSGGCENPPAEQGCDPVMVTETLYDGTALLLGECG